LALIHENLNIREILRERPVLGAADVRSLERAFGGPQLSEARQEAMSLQAELTMTGSGDKGLLQRAGIGAYFLGQHTKADELLSRVPNDALAAYYHAMALSALERYQDAEQRFGEADKLGYDHVECTLRRAGEIRAQGRLEEADKTIKSVSREGAARAEYSYQVGCLLADRGDTWGAVEYFERAVDIDPHHQRALFRLAVESAARGNDEDAIHLYERALSRPPFYLGALINLGLLYEDQENYRAAAYCFRRVLQCEPNHPRARLFLKDIEATDDMYYDEESARSKAKLEQLLGRPVTDFELSVRSRNCLQGMNIFTLGDLTKITEQDLLAGKNFGETSLQEIREMMQAHGLRIGQNISTGRPFEPLWSAPNLSPQEQSTLLKPMADLNLSVRARKCMARLNISTVGELIQRTADELLASRNFGVTSLNEVRAKLTELNLKLRND
jgi:DNA-directed RNA polymerase subunit alpha